MYLTDLLIKNNGPIRDLRIKAPFNPDGTPKPLILVGVNGSGKTSVLSVVADALIEFAAQKFLNVTESKGLSRSWYRMLGSRITSVGATYEFIGLKFDAAGRPAKYRSKVGTLPSDLAQIWYSEFGSFPNEPESNKMVEIAQDQVEPIFQSGAYGFFPANRSELPHWANDKALTKDPGADFNLSPRGVLDAPIVVDKALQELKPWFVDVMLNSMVPAAMILQSQDLTALKTVILTQALSMQTMSVLNRIFSLIFNDSTIMLGRTVSQGDARLVVAKGQQMLVPTLDGLSAGQGLLLAIFATVLRYGTKNLPSRPPNDIEGIILVDEIDAHLHADLQHDILPALIQMFPRVQFIVSSHSPLFALGMEKKLGEDGFKLIELPSGLTISAERFSEFDRSFAYYRETQKFDAELQQKLREATRPIILCEGETDPRYLKAAALALGLSDLAEGVDFDWVGKRIDNKESQGAGSGNLKRAERFLHDNPDVLLRKTVLLYDCDQNVQHLEEGNLIVRGLPSNPDNNKCVAGIENLFPEDLLDDSYYQESHKQNGSTRTVVFSLRKTQLCDWVCTANLGAACFEKFREPLTEIRRLVLPDSQEVEAIDDATITTNVIPISQAAKS